ncbi:heavy metal translocating P-type ATPase [Gemella massiliensis]|uniref:heavy metal translocating P-type ATPase n=1 Tax=Gemella massiliensis TaxID=1909670 RepID=UPI000930919C|nr:heavy metal translocating P-type ATPase [Gemella massiliensis]
MKIEAFDIEGMTCAACAMRIEKAISKLDSVDVANVNLAGEKLTVRYKDNKTTDEIINKVEKVGYKAKLQEESSFTEKENKKQLELSKIKSRLIVSIIFALPLLYISMAEMINLPNIIDMNTNSKTFVIIQFILVIPILYMGRNFFIKGYRTLFTGYPNMDSLVALGTSAAFIYSLYNSIRVLDGNIHAVHHLYYESAGVILTLITLGKYFESLSKGKTMEAVNKLIQLTPEKATLIKNNQEIIIKATELLVGDIVGVKAGEKISADGVVVSGNAVIDEAMLTGESMPVEKKKDDKVVAGTINTNGYITFRVTDVGKDTTLSKIINLVENTQNNKGELSRLTDKVAGIFVPTIIVLALISGLYWYFIADKNIEFSLTIAISVLVIACPCALGLATPTAIMVGAGRGAENGILIKNGKVLEIISKATAVVLDKTGTITKGAPEVTDVNVKNYDRENFLILLKALEKKSEHPLAKAVIDYTDNISDIQVENFETIVGKGVRANYNNKKLLLGNKKLMNENNIDISKFENEINDYNNESKTVVYLAENNMLLGIVAIRDEIKESSRLAIKKMIDSNLEVIMLTGDNRQTAEKIAGEVGIKEVISDVLPDEKSAAIKKLQNKDKIVIMVGDGINDAPALVQADIGVAIGTGTDITLDSSDIILLKNDLADVVKAINLSKKTEKNIKENLFWAFIYNIIGIPMAMGVFYAFGGMLLNPMMASLAMSLSSVSVVLNALRLKRIKL